jgi:uncharacterized membrane protein YdjX (TVP38/TMEM64 family)
MEASPDGKGRSRMLSGLWDLFVLVKYPKLVLLVIMTFLAYGMFRNEGVQTYFHSLGDMGYLAAFVGGGLFAFGFGAPFGVAMLATIANDVDILMAAVAGGGGALVTDFLTFKFVRLTFKDEVVKFKGSTAHGLFTAMLRHRVPTKVAFYIVVALAGLAIVSPLPDEFGVALLAGLTTVSERQFAAVAFVLNTIGILIVLTIGHMF